MSSQGKIQTDSKGKGREEIPEASGSGPSAQVHADEQGPNKGGAVSLLDLSSLSTTPPLHVANKNINQWLNNTQTPSGAGTQSIQNKENAQLSSDPGSRVLDELSQELDALATRPFNTQGKPGTSAPTNTPQSCDYNGLRPRAHSTGDADGRRLRMGPQANTMDGSALPLPLFSTSNSSTPGGTSTSMPQNHQAFTASDILQYHAPELPSKSAARTLSSYAPHQTAGVTETSPSTSPTTTVLLNPESSTGTPTLAGIASNNLGLAQNVSQPHQGTLTAAQLLVAAPSVSLSAPAGIAGNVHALAQNLSNLSQDVHQSATQPLVDNTVGTPPSPPIVRQHAQHNLDLPILPPPTTHQGEFVTEPESINHSPTALPFHNFSSIGRQHSPQASTVMWPTRPKSRGKRIAQDLKQLMKDCFCRKPVINLWAIELVDHDINQPSTISVNEHQGGLQNGDIFERTDDRVAKSCLPSLDGRLRRGAASRLDGLPEGDASPPDERTLSGESSNTAQEASNDCEPPANVRAPPKNFFQRWKARRATARERATMRRRGEQYAVRSNVVPTYPDIPASACIIP